MIHESSLTPRKKTTKKGPIHQKIKPWKTKQNKHRSVVRLPVPFRTHLLAQHKKKAVGQWNFPGLTELAQKPVSNLFAKLAPVRETRYCSRDRQSGNTFSCKTMCSGRKYHGAWYVGFFCCSRLRSQHNERWPLSFLFPSVLCPVYITPSRHKVSFLFSCSLSRSSWSATPLTRLRSGTCMFPLESLHQSL